MTLAYHLANLCYEQVVYAQQLLKTRRMVTAADRANGSGIHKVIGAQVANRLVSWTRLQRYCPFSRPVKVADV